MSDERKIILTMLKEGKITEDEALNLLDSLNNKEESNSTEDDAYDIPKDRESKFEKKVENFVDKILSSVEVALSKAGDLAEDTIKKSDIDFGNIVISTSKFKGLLKKSTTIEDLDDVNLYVNNKNGTVDISKWDNDYIQCSYTVYYDDKVYSGDENFLVKRKEGENNFYFGVNKELDSKYFSIELKLFIPENIVSILKVENSNGKVKVDTLDAESVDISSTNGRIISTNINANEVEFTTTNSKIEMKETNCSSLKTHTTNGKIVLIKAYCDNIDSKNTNGSIHLTDVSDNVKSINLQSTNGGIYLENLDLDRPIHATLQGRNTNKLSHKFVNIQKSGKVTEAYTESYTENSDNKLIINLKTTNGRVSIG